MVPAAPFHTCPLLARSRHQKEEPIHHCCCPWLLQAWGNHTAVPAPGCREVLYRQLGSAGDNYSSTGFSLQSLLPGQQRTLGMAGNRHWKEGPACCHCCPLLKCAPSTAAAIGSRGSFGIPLMPGSIGNYSSGVCGGRGGLPPAPWFSPTNLGVPATPSSYVLVV